MLFILMQILTKLFKITSGGKPRAYMFSRNIAVSGGETCTFFLEVKVLYSLRDIFDSYPVLSQKNLAFGRFLNFSPLEVMI